MPLSVGTLVDSIPVPSAAGESYAAYLAGSADPTQPLPILILFDPAARGALAVDAFRTVAEEHGMLLVGSNNCRNGPYEQNFEIANRLFSEIFGSYPIDERRIYLSGFSGGSRLAASIAVLTGQMAGVIGCGAGFDTSSNYLPGPGADFLYAGIVGRQDMNYPEMHHTRDWLDKLSIRNKLITFDGPHRWPPPPELLRAMDWLTLTAHNQGRIVLSPSRMEAGFHRALAAARNYEADGLPLAALREYTTIYEGYQEVYALDTLRLKMQAMRESVAYRDAAAGQEQLFAEEEEWTSGFWQLADKALQDRESNGALSKWKAAWKRFRRKYETGGNPENAETRAMQARVEGYVMAFGIEKANAYRAAGQYEQSLVLSRLLTQAFPERAYAFIRMAEDHARLRQDEAMFQALRQALSLGFSNTGTLEANPAFAPYLKRDAWLSLFGSHE
ncbi:hypothetical protein [Robiginitalea sp. SC105]|uniref:hypothetical protein n=1 Tax=Robiginitalea sp. SC105 TaxID=2762332 RepID=UPI00163B5FB2|nr:hypothetical protein [Robiginitalea sp. SC105]MBC2837743.1 hypothetical protein [Robiginitalea sp. SC105]